MGARKILGIAAILSGLAFMPVQSGIKQKTDMVLCLDLSASTNGLLNDIRDHLWKFTNTAKRDFPETDVRVGVVVFARPSFGAENNYVKVLCDLTDDYDMLSYYLFLLNANVEKGDQCDGSALYVALKDLTWSKDEASTKMIYLFGNNNVRMCGFDYKKSCEMAFKRNVPVHSVYCGNGGIGLKYYSMWKEIAESTGGDFYTYRLLAQTPLKKLSPEAQKLSAINENLLDTYLPFTRDGKLHYDLMVAADDNSKKMNEKFFYERCSYKFSPYFEEQTPQWDLVSLMKKSFVDLANLNRAYLPQEYQTINHNELREVVNIKIKRRESLEKQMKNLLLNSDIDNIPLPPIDSIFISGLDKKASNVMTKMDMQK